MPIAYRQKECCISLYAPALIKEHTFRYDYLYRYGMQVGVDVLTYDSLGKC
jgi:hypothetical protein